MYSTDPERRTRWPSGVAGGPTAPDMPRNPHETLSIIIRRPTTLRLLEDSDPSQSYRTRYPRAPRMSEDVI